MASICEGMLATAKSRATWLSGALFIAALSGIGASYQGGGQDLRYGGPFDWNASGPEGGPFSDTGFTAVLGNRSQQSLDWSASSIPSFMQLDQANGTLQSHTRTPIRVTLVSGIAQNLTPGTYSERLSFHDNSGSATDIDISCTLSVRPAASSSSLLPLTDFSTQGPAAGPFQPDNQTYALTNTGASDLNWQATAADGWVSVSPTSGHLAPGASANVGVSIADPNTSGLTNGMHQSVVEWRDVASSAVIHSRSVNLNVLAGSGSSGWTVFTPSPDTRTIYVSSSGGNDGNDGLSPSTPKRTIGAGKSLLRNGSPDWLLLKTGDAWDENFGWMNSGRSATERMLVSSYGTSPVRPLVRSGNSSGMQGYNIRNLAVVGVHFVANNYDGAAWIRAMEFDGGSQNLLIEDCVCESYNNGLVFTGAMHANLAVRRNVIIDSYDMVNTQGSGIYMSDTSSVLIEENVIDNNGSTPSHQANGWPGHNIYCQNGTDGVVIRGNIISRTDGVQLRGGGVMENNLFLKNAISISVGGGVQPDGGGVTATVRNNVVLDGNDFPASGPYSGGGARGWGIHSAGNIQQSTIQGNIVAHNVSGHGPCPVQFGVANNGRGVENTMFSDNVVYAWNGSTVFQGSASQTLNIQLENNKFQNEITAEPLIQHNQSSSTGGVTSGHNVFDTLAGPNACMQLAGGNISLAQWKPMVHDTTSVEQSAQFPDPGRTIATYHQSIGGAPSLDAFIAGARQQSKANWRTPYTADAVNDYIRAGFGLPPAGFSP